MTKPRISVVVPVYNVEPYLAQCVESILGQTMGDIEVIAVDDGSTDGGGGLLDEYAAKDARVTVVHKPNGGISSARNMGLPLIKGEWFTFVDSDDWLDLDMYERMVDAGERYGADVVSSSVSVGADEVLDEGILERYLLVGDVLSTNKVFRTETLLPGFAFEPGDVSIDIKGTFDLMMRARRWVIISGAFYYYRQAMGSYGRSPFKERDLNCVRMTTAVARECEGLSGGAYDLALNHVIHSEMDVLGKGAMYGCKSEKDEKVYRDVVRPYCREIRSRFWKSMGTGYFSRNEKVKILMISISYRFYAAVARRRMPGGRGSVSGPEYVKC